MDTDNHQLNFQCFLQGIRSFFTGQNFLEIMTPIVVENPGMETHIHPYQVHGVYNQKPLGYLHTSPEFELKFFLAHQPTVKNAFGLNFCFRDEPFSPQHRPQFIMLEWYRVNQFYDQVKNDSWQLYQYLIQYMSKLNLPPKKVATKPITMTMAECFKQFLNANLFDLLETDTIHNYIKQYHPDVPLPTSQLSWEDYFWLLFLNKIEPELSTFDFLILDQFPHHLSALSTLNQSNPLVCDRFEIYLNGIELANCYNELTSLTEQKARFEKQSQIKKELYQYQLQTPERFYTALKKGLPKSSGIALGVERLYNHLYQCNYFCFN
jgi:lysyl-tRNA synthetase class 2